MDFLAKSRELRLFLAPFKKIFETEVLNIYPNGIDDYQEEWLCELEMLSEKELFELECRRPLEQLRGSSFGKHLDNVSELVKIPANCSQAANTFEDWAFVDVKHKKKHEILSLYPLFQNLKKELNYDHIVDIGGGVGHLARILAHYGSIETYTIDRDKKFQEAGMMRAKKYRLPKNSKPLHFENLTFGEAQKDSKDEEKLKNIVNQNSFVMGLHTCGALAHKVMETSVKFRATGLLNFGCCYHKMNPEIDFPISNIYKKEDHLHLNIFAMTLATRAHVEKTFHDFVTKRRVKYYRYALHFWLYHKLGITDCFSVGETHTRDYHGAFSTYALKKLKELKMPLPNASELDEFYEAESKKPLLKKIYLTNIIRWSIGRPLELYILLDRALYLEEKGLKVELKAFFDEELSPRNIGILAMKQN